jgi:mannose-6-phosphate isomerase-like protein (cupin superfamily)
MTTLLSPLHIATTHLRLRPDAGADTLPVTEAFWPDLIAGKYGDFHHEFLVSASRFEADWDSWEIHPNGDEIVILLNGAMDFILERSEGNQTASLRHTGDFVFVPRATWHTANMIEPANLLFITAGEGTQGRPR